MNLKILFLFFMSCIFFKVQSQSLSNKVVATGGSYSTASWGSLSATIGEAAITTFSSTGVTLLQGFQQPTSGLAGINASKKSVWITTAYPNPAINQVFLELTLAVNSTVTYKIFDMNGKELLIGNFITEAMHTTIKKLDVAGLSNGMYLISLYNNGESIQNIKIQINH